jgi:protein TonB
LIVAVVGHVAALLLPLPRQDIVPPLVIAPPSRELSHLPIPPPPRETPRELPRRDLARRVLLPATEAPDLAPVSDSTETVRSMLTTNGPGEIDLLPLSPLPPPDRVLDSGTPGLVSPVQIERVEPIYPRAAILARLTGRVVLEAIVTEDGRVESVVVLAAPRTDPGFSDAAVAAVSAWRYRPGSYRGRPVAVRLAVTIDFALE